MVSKVQERIYVEAAATLLNANWKIVEIPEPLDFEVHGTEGVFGVEVRQVFVDTEEIYGSPTKRLESKNTHLISQIAKLYYASGGSPVSIKFLGPLSTVDMQSFVNLIVASAPTYPGENVTIISQGVKVFLTPVPSAYPNYSCWILVNDKVGWVRSITTDDLQHAVNRKQNHLSSYKAKYEDIDLLLVADRSFNSGRLAKSNLASVNNPGFRDIYFLSYPDTIQRVG